MLPRVVIYKDAYQYGAVNLFADEIAQGFRKLGRQTVFVDLSDIPGLQANLSNAFSGGNVEFVLSFGAAGYCFESHGKNIYDQFSFPFFAFQIDHPAHHIDRFCFDNIIISAMDRSHVRFLDNYFKGSKKAFFMPHGGCRSKYAGTVREKKINILFPASYMNPNEHLVSIKRLEPFSQKLISETVEIILANDAIPIENALGKVAGNLGIDIYDEKLKEKVAVEIIRKIEIFVRALKRMKMLHALDDAGIAVDIYGNGWPASSFKCHRIHSALPFNDINDLMTESKIVINAANFADGAHERVFTTMLNGALSLSDYNPYFEENFKENSEIVFYRWTKMDRMPEIVSNILDDNDMREEITRNGTAAATAAHTWDHRAAKVLEIVKEVRAR